LHEKILGKRLASSVERLPRKKLLTLLAFVMALLSSKKLSKKQRRSLAITEEELGIRGQVKREEAETVPAAGKRRSRKRTRNRKGNPQATRAMRYAKAHGVSLKEAWKHVKRAS
jgi:hypothetical protein